MAKPSEPKGKDNFTRNIVIAVVVGVALIMVVPTVLSSRTDTTAAIPASVSAERGYGIVYNEELTDVPVIDIYQDFQCPACGQFEALHGGYVESLISEKKATVVYHALSFLGPESVSAANAAACSADEGKYLDFQRVLYTNLSRKSSGSWSNDVLVGLGKEVGITSQKFSECVVKGNYLGWVSNVSTAGAKADINSTPTVFINGKEIDRQSEYSDIGKFKAAVERG